jgi:hypothetical protein
MSMNGDEAFEPSGGIVVTTTPEQAKEFVERMMGDDDLRARFEQDTRAVLADYGIQIAEERVPDGITAPPKEEFEALRDAVAGRTADPVATFGPVFNALRCRSFKALTFRGPGKGRPGGPE